MATQPIDRQKAKLALKQRTTRPLIQRTNKRLLPEVNSILARMQPVRVCRSWDQDWSNLSWFNVWK